MDELSLLRSRIEDVLGEAYENGIGFLGFLNEAEVSFANGYLKNQGVNYCFWGGYPLASRCYLCIAPYDEPNTSEYPFKPFKINARDSAQLSHRDYLGALMSLGIKRDCIGDILILNNHSSVIFLRNDVASFIKEQLTIIAREGVCVSEYWESILNYEPKYEEINIIVSSMRLDNIVSSCARVSRTEASNLISSELVFLNYSALTKASHTVRENDMLSIRGYGKYKISQQVSTTRKDRLVIRVLHYI